MYGNNNSEDREIKSPECLERLKEARIIAVLRVNSYEQAVKAGRLLAEGGIRAIEVTMTVPNACDALQALSRQVGGRVVLGAGTVMSLGSAGDCLDS